MFGESQELVNAKVGHATACGLNLVYCVGEN
jgi:triosephosphate isomerase